MRRRASCRVGNLSETSNRVSDARPSKINELRANVGNLGNLEAITARQLNISGLCLTDFLDANRPPGFRGFRGFRHGASVRIRASAHPRATRTAQGAP
jgi:hypothetical protein